MTSRTGSAWRISGIWRKLVELRLNTGREGLTFACSRGPWAGVARDGGQMKNQNRKLVPLSPSVEKPLNSKVIKIFVPELRGRECFSCFEIPMFYVIYIWTLYVHFTNSRIWLWHTGCLIIDAPINMMMIYYWDKRNGSHLEPVLSKLHPLS